MPLNSLGGSALQRGTWRHFMCMAPLVISIEPIMW